MLAWKRVTRHLPAAVAALGLSFPAAAQPPTFKAETQLALVSFEYVPSKGRLVEELRAEDILILQDGVPQKVALFEGGKFHPRSVPIEFAILFDCSGSVRNLGERNPELFNSGLLEEFPHASLASTASPIRSPD